MIFYVIAALIVVADIAIIALILAQKKNASSGFGSAMSGMGGGDSYWSNNKGRSAEGQLVKYTKIIAFVSFVLVLASNLVLLMK
jgi:preprotein translocase subunit SecG